MHIIDKKVIENVVTMKEVINIVRDSYIEYSQCKTLVPVRTSLNIKKFKGIGLFMPAYSEEMKSFGVKVVSVFPENRQKGLPTIIGMILLNDAETGQPLAMLEASSITALRTGAASGLATDLLARPEASTLAVIGCGVQALTQIRAITEVRATKKVFLYDLDRERVVELVRKVKKMITGSEYIITTSADKAIEKADIVVTVTTSKKAVFSGRKLNPGTHINAVGSFTPEMQEIDEVALLRADKVVVDSREAVLKESGDLIKPIKNNVFSPGKIYAELGEIASTKKPGREREEEITIFKTVGLALLDITLARLVYKKVIEKKLGLEIKL